jgi:hypothetical protein
MLNSLRVALAVLISTAAVCAQNEKKLTARELFYSPVTEAKPAPAAAKPASPKPAQIAKKQQTQPPKTAPDRTEPVYQAKQRSETTRTDTPSTNVVQKVSNGSDVTGPPLALRYSLLKQNSDGEYVEVDPETVFRSGDRLKVSVEANDAAHLYIVQQGSSKAWNVLFPNEDTTHGDNRVDRNRRVTIPGGGRFTFDDQAGTERLFIVLSRTAESDLEKIIYDLSRKQASPASTPAEETRPKMMLAQSRIDDSVVNRLRGHMIARDLVFEKVDDKPAPSGKPEKAMYYATQDRSSRARIVVDLNLRHQ